MPRSPDRLYRKIVTNPKATQRARIDALKLLARPPYALLERLVSNPKTPARLAKVAADLYAFRCATEQTPDA
jgi:hypothetical protein